MKNEYIPYPAIIESIREEGPRTKTLRIVFEDKSLMEDFIHQPGQFVQVSLLGVGEAPLSIVSSPHHRGFLELTVRGMGKLTRAIIRLKPGEKIYLRGPYGSAFPVEEIKGRDIYFVAGGIGLAPLRSVINLVLNRREEFGKVVIVYGAGTPAELCFKKELEVWSKIEGVEVRLIVDLPEGYWEGRTGVVTELWEENEPWGEGVACVCGPPVMMKCVIEKLIRTGFNKEDIHLTLERQMKCGIGKCGHCGFAGKFVCVDGPVFSFSELEKLPDNEKAFSL